jgi:TonB family protein
MRAVLLLSALLATPGFVPLTHAAAGAWAPTAPLEVSATDATTRASRDLYQGRLTPTAAAAATEPGYRVIIAVDYDETGTPRDARVHASDDITHGRVLEQVSLQLARGAKREPRLKDGRPAGFTALVPFHFPVRDDEGPATSAATRPRLQRSQAPAFPDLLVQRGESGGAILEITIDKSGEVSRARVLESSHEVCGDAARAAVKNWIFSPVEENGRPVRSRWRIAFAFESAGRPAELKWRLAPRPNLGAYTVIAAP